MDRKHACRSFNPLVALLCACVLAFGGNAFAQIGKAELQAEILSILEDITERQRLVGLQAAVSLDGELVFSECIGLADMENPAPVTKETRFEIASITKAFTGTVALMLSERGEFDLDAPIQKYVPTFPDKTNERRGGVITGRLIAGGLSGIRHYRIERNGNFYSKHYDNVADALVLFQDSRLVRKPGTGFSYSSYSFNLLAAAIQGAAGKRFQDVVQESLFTPLELKGTGFIDVRHPMRHRARTYGFDHPHTRARSEEIYVMPTMDHSYNMGGGNMYSTAEDLVRFGSAFLEPGFFTAGLFEQIYAPHYTNDGEEVTFSDGWFIKRDAAGRKFLNVNGSYPGVQAELRVYPDDKLVVALLTNTRGLGSIDLEFVRGVPEAIVEACINGGNTD